MVLVVLNKDAEEIKAGLSVVFPTVELVLF